LGTDEIRRTREVVGDYFGFFSIFGADSNLDVVESIYNSGDG